MLKASNVLRLILIVTILAALVVPILGTAVNNLETASIQSNQNDVSDGQPTIELVCIPGDPGSSGGDDGGC